jgi:ANTAR domain/GAF domain
VPSYDDLVVSLRRTADELVGQRDLRDVDATLSKIVAAAVQLVPGADAGGISMTENGEVTSRNPTAPGITKLDQLQSELHEGPCISAIDEPAEDGVVLAEDLAGADGARWPRFSPQAVQAGYRSMLSTQLAFADGVRAALNLYASRSHAFDEEDRRTAGLFALQAAPLLYSSREAERFQRALQSRDVIGQAKGILIERYGVDDAEAFQMLVKASQDTNIKLATVAEWLRGETIEKHTAGATAHGSNHA